MPSLRTPLLPRGLSSSNNESQETSESLNTILDLEPTNSNSLLNIPSSNSSITIAHLNIRSLIPKMDILRDSLAVSSSTKPITILTLSETWLNNDINDCQLIIQGYDLFRKDRVAHGGGVAAYVPNHLKVHRRPDLETNDADILCLELRLRSRRILLGVTYRPPNDIDFFTQFDNIALRACLETNKSLILIGDFNCNTLAPNSQNAKLLFATTNGLRLTQLVATPTRITENSRTIIDLIFSSDQLTASEATVTPCSLSDHHIVSCQVKIKPPRPPQRFVHSRLLHKCNIEALKNDLGMAPWHVAEIFDDIDDQVNFWESLYLKVLDHHAPKRRFRVRAKSLPWIDDDLRNLMRYRDWLHRRAIRENSSIIWDIYKSARNKVTSDLRQAKTTYYHRLCSSNIHPAQLWKQLNNLLGSKNNCDVKSMVVNNRELTDKTEIAEAMNSHFIHAASLLTTPPHHLNPGTDPKPFFSLSPATEDEVFGIVLSLDSSKSSGPSDINAKCLQLTISSIVTSIVRIINLSLQMALYHHVGRRPMSLLSLRKETSRIPPTIDLYL